MNKYKQFEQRLSKISDDFLEATRDRFLELRDRPILSLDEKIEVAALQAKHQVWLEICNIACDLQLDNPDVI